MSSPQPSRKEDEEEKQEEEEEGEKVVEIIKATSTLLDRIKEMINEIIKTTIEGLDGAKLGREVGELYKSLVESGFPEQEALAMAKQFFQQKLEAVPKLSTLIEQLGKSMSGPSIIMAPGKSRKKTAKTLKAIAEQIEDEEKKKKLLKAAELLEELEKEEEGE